MDPFVRFHFVALLYRADVNTAFGIDCRYYDDDSADFYAPVYAAMEAAFAAQCRSAGVHYVSMDAMWRWAPRHAHAEAPPDAGRQAVTLAVPCQLLEVGTGEDAEEYVELEGMACVLWTHAILEEMLETKPKDAGGGFLTPAQWARAWYAEHGTTQKAREYIREVMRSAWLACRSDAPRAQELVAEPETSREEPSDVQMRTRTRAQARVAIVRGGARAVRRRHSVLRPSHSEADGAIRAVKQSRVRATARTRHQSECERQRKETLEKLSTARKRNEMKGRG